MNFTFLFHYFQRNKAVTFANTVSTNHRSHFFFFFDRSYHKLPINMVVLTHKYTQVTHFPSANYTHVHTGTPLSHLCTQGSLANTHASNACDRQRVENVLSTAEFMNNKKRGCQLVFSPRRGKYVF